MARPGIVLYHGIEGGHDLRKYARVAEDAGFHSLWVTERYFHEETFSLLGFLAAETTRIRLGLGVTNPYTRHPALLAMASATLDRISQSRFILGLGRAERSLIEDRMGVPYEDPASTMREAVRVIRGLLAGERVSASEGSFKLSDARLAVSPTQPHLPIFLAAIGPKALRLAGAIADGVLLNAYVPTEYVRYAVSEVKEAARRAGRDPASVEIACMLVLRVTDTPEEIWPGLKRRIVRLLDELHVGEVLLEKGGFDSSILAPLRASVAGNKEEAGVELIMDRMVESFYVVGSADRCRERIAEYRKAGVQLPLLLPRLEDFEATSHLSDT